MVDKSVLCTICARGGSKGVINKNIRPILGKPLIAYTIEHAIQSKLFKHIVVSTDSDEITKECLQYGAEVFFKRNSELASDTSGKRDAIRDAFIRSEKHYDIRFDYLVDLDVTSPLRDVSDILNAFNQFLINDNDNLITGMKARRNPYFNMVELDSNGKIFVSKAKEEDFLRRQDCPTCYDMNASIYIWKRSSILNESSNFLDKTGIYLMPEERSIDIDSELDFKFVDFILREKYAQG